MGAKSCNERLKELAKESQNRVLSVKQKPFTERREAKEPLTKKLPSVAADTQLDIFRSDVVRPELNISRWANFVFKSPHNPKVYKTRERTFPMVLKDDSGTVTEEV